VEADSIAEDAWAESDEVETLLADAAAGAQHADDLAQQVDAAGPLGAVLEKDNRFEDGEVEKTGNLMELYMEYIEK
jgi:hypothetical protein